MLFNSFDFIFFFIFIVLAFWILSAKYRWVLLLIASYYFYMSWEPTYIVLILFSTIVDYFICLHLTNSPNKRKKRLGLGLSLFQGLGLLFFFKYFDFFQNSISHVFQFFHYNYTPPHFDILLPVGISFYTFQTLSYTIDVYRDKIKPERHLGKFALYVSFFPQLIAGPIERADQLLPQLQKNDQKFNPNQFKEGIILFFWGLFKKVVIADNAAVIVEYAYDPNAIRQGSDLLLGTYFFAFQLYSDFSGYSDMAVGIAKILGYELMNNFKFPFFSISLTEFWRKWHISLSNWFKDYVYIPLGGSKKGKIREQRNILTTMLLSGIWHGASWNMVFWGLINGVFLCLEKIVFISKIKSRRWLNSLRIIVTFNIFCFTLILFRSTSIHQSLDVVSKISQTTFKDLINSISSYINSNVMMGIFILVLTEIYFLNKKSILSITTKNKITRYSFYILLVFAILLLGTSSGREFIYFQF